MKDEQLFLRDPILWRSIHQYDRATYDDRHYSGTILLDGVEVAQTLMCIHCNQHFLNIRIPGKARGWCSNCNAPVCHKPECDTCVPFMQMIENIEKYLPVGHKPIQISVQGEVPQNQSKDSQLIVVGD